MLVGGDSCGLCADELRCTVRTVIPSELRVHQEGVRQRRHRWWGSFGYRPGKSRCISSTTLN